MKLFTLHKSADGQFYSTIHGNNGEITHTSEMLKTRNNAIKGCMAVVNRIRPHAKWLLSAKDEFIEKYVNDKTKSKPDSHIGAEPDKMYVE